MHRRLRELGDPEIAAHSRRFFQAQQGGYAEGDRFHGVRVPVVRRLMREYRHLDLDEIARILQSPWHEERLLAVLLMVDQFRRAQSGEQRRIYQRYLSLRAHVNNWDLVDGSAPGIVGAWLLERDRAALYRLAASSVLWDRRIAMLATLHFIRHDDYGDTLELAALLRDDREDLIHKATGWMLREVGKRDRATLEHFLMQHYAAMPRTMLRYAIERLPDARRRAYLEGSI